MRSLLLILIGAAIAIGGICAAWRYAPLTTHNTDGTALMAAAAEPDVREAAQDSKIVHVSPPEIASTLRVIAKLKSSTVRPAEPECGSAEGNVLAATCNANDHVRVVIQSVLFRNLALVTVITRNGRQEKVLLRINGKWVIVGSRGYLM